MVADKTLSLSLEAATTGVQLVGKGVGAVSNTVGSVAERVLPQEMMDAATITKQVAMERIEAAGKAVEELLKDPTWRQARRRGPRATNWLVPNPWWCLFPAARAQPPRAAAGCGRPQPVWQLWVVGCARDLRPRLWRVAARSSTRSPASGCGTTTARSCSTSW